MQSAEEKNIIIIIIFFSSALCASLRRLRREPSVSIRKKYPLKPRVAKQAFPFGFGAKKDSGKGFFSVLTAREMTLVPHSLLLNRTETLATKAIILSA